MNQTDNTYLSSIIGEAIFWYDKEPELYKTARMEAEL